MLIPALLVVVGLAAIAFAVARRRRGQAAALPTPVPPAAAASPLRSPCSPPPTLEVAHASRSGALALRAAAAPRFRPAHRCIEEIRRRCHSDFAGALVFLENQLNQQISSNPVEQARYWIDLACGLRLLNLHEALPALLRRADEALDLPLADQFAAEIVSFAAFAEYLHDPLTAEGQAALRVLRVAMEGVRRFRIAPSLCADAAFGDAVRRLSENCPNAVNPRLVLVFVEAIRHGRRLFHNRPIFRDDPIRRQTVRWQHAFLKDAEPVLREYLHDIGPELTRLLEAARGRARRDILLALAELQADTDDALLHLLGDPDFPDRVEALACLRWSRSPLVPPVLCGIARLSSERPGRWLRRLGVQRQPASAEIAAAIRALRGHPSDESERVLLACTASSDPAWRRLGLESLGWWEPIRRTEVLRALGEGRQDAHPDVRRAALAAQARLGDCSALHALADLLHCTHSDTAQDAIRLVAAEGITWLWPDLDALTEADESGLAAEAWEAIEQLREQFLGPLG